ncbi:MAG: GNAT family N-acetyltransferase [SAR202 cluster bacterium Io17-Chloro-G9]|nr:MAG: GNAT family N-acetyltransferase [SAR202 cluster bacterium Io17-Chloro-G9]
MTRRHTLDTQVRRGLPTDLETIIGFNSAMALETEGKTLDQGLLRTGVQTLLADSSRGFYLVAESGGQVVGQLMITTEWSDWRNAYFWWIQSVYVSEDFRRMGIYRCLNDQVRTQALNQGDVCGIRLYVDRDNRVAQQVYTNLDMVQARYDLFEIEFDR